MEPTTVNSFDAVILFLVLVAGVMGFMTGLLRSLATILGYAAAVPVAMLATPSLAAIVAGHPGAPSIHRWVLTAAIFIVTGLVLGALMRASVTAAFGPTASIPDRLAGAILGAARIGLAAVLVVLVFDRIVPAHLEPAFLSQSRLKPILSSAAVRGLKSLPPDVEAMIDRLKTEHGI